MLEIKGVIAAIATPLHEDESINEQELRNHVERVISAGVHGLFCNGTNGEFYVMSYDEKVRIMEITIDQNKGRLPVIAGTGCISTNDTIVLTQKAKALGADCASIVCPYFAESSQDTLYSHYTAVADAVDIPMLIYNLPARTGINIEYQTVKKLSKHKNIVGIKDSSGNFDNMLRYLEETENFAVLSGNDQLVLWNLMAGGNGAVSGVSNVLPKTMVSIYDLWAAGDFAKAKKAQDSVRALRDCMKLANPNSIVKRAANLRGIPLGPARAPFNVSGEKIDKALIEMLKLYEDAE
jgi:4-hydroxy-tetrahydrodipicolinate synthase